MLSGSLILRYTPINYTRGNLGLWLIRLGEREGGKNIINIKKSRKIYSYDYLYKNEKSKKQ